MKSILYMLANKYVSVVCKLAITRYCFFGSFVLCVRQVLANSNYVMCAPMDTIQLSFHSLLVDIHSFGAIVPQKMRRRWNSRLENEEEFTTKNIRSERMMLKVEEKRKRLIRKFNCQSERRSKKISHFSRNQFSVQKDHSVPRSVPELFNKGRKILGKEETRNNNF